MKTVEPQYDKAVDLAEKRGIERLGIGINFAWNDDPKRLAFTFARYKFVAKMFDGMKKVLEIGCGDGFASRVVKQAVGSLIATDIDPVFINDANSRNSTNDWPIEFRVHDMLKGPIDTGTFDGVYSLDVLEHIPLEDETEFLVNIKSSLSENGVLIIGTPSLESQPYASRASILGHVNCKSHETMRSSLSNHFKNVFIFSMNDEVVHTGYARMAQYVIGLAVGPLK